MIYVMNNSWKFSEEFIQFWFEKRTRFLRNQSINFELYSPALHTKNLKGTNTSERRSKLGYEKRTQDQYIEIDIYKTEVDRNFNNKEK